MKMLFLYSLLFDMIFIGYCRYDAWNYVPCSRVYKPSNCRLENFTAVTLDDFDRCGPAMLPNLATRNYFLGAAGRRITYKQNKDAFDRIRIVPHMLRDVSKYTLKTKVLGEEVDLPIGVSPVALQKLASTHGEIDTVSGISFNQTIMIVSTLTTSTLADIAHQARQKGIHLWMQAYLFENRSITSHILRSAARNGFKAVVIDADSPIYGHITCGAKRSIVFPRGVQTELVDYEVGITFNPTTNFRDIGWFKQVSKLPVIVKGILSGKDAVLAIKAGASAIIVSNHGGRQLDGVPATIEALANVVDAVKEFSPNTEVYMDGGVRSGTDVYKAIALGAKFVFIGRPIIWGLAYKGAAGVKEILSILRKEFGEAMRLAGYTNVRDIRRDTLLLPT